MAETSPPTSVERFVSLFMGGGLLLLAVYSWGWGFSLGIAGLRETAVWQPVWNKALLAAAAVALVSGFGAWRMLRLGFTEDKPVGRVVLGLFALATVVGVVMSLM
jgi:hypothetical protein